jgi:hypothetical protein
MSVYLYYRLLLPKLALRVINTILPLNRNMRIVFRFLISRGELDSDVIVALAAFGSSVHSSTVAILSVQRSH